MSKMEKENERLSSAMARTRNMLKANETKLTRKGVSLGTSFVIGALEKNGKLASLPTIPGVPRIVTLGIVFNGLGFVAPKGGKIEAALDGMGESAFNIASYKWGKGEDVAGVSENDVGGPRARRRRTETQLAEQRAATRRLEAQLLSQAREELAAQNDPALADYIEVPAAA